MRATMGCMCKESAVTQCSSRFSISLPSLALLARVNAYIWHESPSNELTRGHNGVLLGRSEHEEALAD